MSALPDATAPEPQVLARELAQASSDAFANDVLVLDIAAITTLADYFVISSADNERMLRAVVRDVSDRAAKEGVRLIRQEGTPESGWVLLDFGDVVVHAFSKQEREFYQLDRLWADAPRILVIQ